MATMPLVGEDLAGYRLLSVVGRGGMSVVYQAENPRLGSIVALKVLSPDLASDDVFRARFLQESRIAASIRHPNVIPIFDMGAHGDLLYIAMHYAAGTDLRTLVRNRRQLPPAEAMYVVGQVGRALDLAHRHDLVHRDVKPANVLLEPAADEDDAEHVYLADFGITKHAVSRSGLTPTGQLVGTLDYIAPEQIEGKPIDSHADLYSLGCVMYEITTGRVPFAGDADAAVLWAHLQESPVPPSMIRPELPTAFDDVIARALAKEPTDRYNTCREMVSDARRAFGGTEHGRVDLVARPGRYPRHAVTSTGFGGQLGDSRPPSPPPQAPPPTPSPATPSAEPVPAAASAPDVPEAPPPGPPSPPGPPPQHNVAHPDPPPGRRRRRTISRRAKLLAGALFGVLLLAAAAALWLPRQHSPSTSQAAGKHATVTTTPSHATSSGTPSQTMSSGMSSNMSPPPVSSALRNTLVDAEDSAVALGEGHLLPERTCRDLSATHVRCDNPALGVSSVDFQTYPSLNALYDAYVARITKLHGGVMPRGGNCTRFSSEGEISWNHHFEHLGRFTLSQVRAGHLMPDTQAAGRVFCTLGNSLTIVWTQNDGMMLAEEDGADAHEVTYLWWRRMHHLIAMRGTMKMPH